jgi:hypothetical protein
MVQNISFCTQKNPNNIYICRELNEEQLSSLEHFQIQNNFPHWNISKFGIEFELKSEEALGFENQ